MRKETSVLWMCRNIKILLFYNSTVRLSLLFWFQLEFHLKFRKYVYPASSYLHGHGRVPVAKIHSLNLYFPLLHVQTTFSIHFNSWFWLLKSTQWLQKVHCIYLTTYRRTHWQWEVLPDITTQRFQQRNVPS